MKVWVIAYWLQNKLDGSHLKVERVSLKADYLEAIEDTKPEVKTTYSGYRILKARGLRK